jgi:hypothetical protein
MKQAMDSKYIDIFNKNLKDLDPVMWHQMKVLMPRLSLFDAWEDKKGNFYKVKGYSVREGGKIVKQIVCYALEEIVTGKTYHYPCWVLDKHLREKDVR